MNSASTGIRAWARAALLAIPVTLVASTARGAPPSLGPAQPSLGWSFAYDGAGQVSALTDPAGRRVEIERTLDGAGRMARAVVKGGGSQIAYAFDRFGRRVETRDASGVVRYEYDGFDRLTAVRRDGLPTVRYGYDALDRVTSVSLGDGFAVQYAYDFRGRLASIDTPAGKVAYDYQAGQGFVARTLPSGTRTIWAYRADGGLETITHAASDGAVLLKLGWSRRPDGLVEEARELGPGGEVRRSYAYDVARRLVGVRGSGPAWSFTYDELGNRLAAQRGDGPARTHAYDWAGRMLLQDGHPCAHEPGGSLTSCEADSAGRRFTYDWRNLLVSVERAAATVRYAYDADSLLVSRTVNGKTTRFVPDPLSAFWRPLLAIEPDGSTTLYVWEGAHVLAVVARGDARFLLHDHLGSTRLAIDRHGRVIGEQAYDPFGAPLEAGEAGSMQPAFAGLFHDPAAGLSLTRLRAYDPSTGRFLQREPALRVPFDVLRDGSAYAYAGNDPVNLFDIDGADPQSPPPVPNAAPTPTWTPTPGPAAPVGGSWSAVLRIYGGIVTEQGRQFGANMWQGNLALAPPELGVELMHARFDPDWLTAVPSMPVLLPNGMRVDLTEVVGGVKFGWDAGNAVLANPPNLGVAFSSYLAAGNNVLNVLGGTPWIPSMYYGLVPQASPAPTTMVPPGAAAAQPAPAAMSQHTPAASSPTPTPSPTRTPLPTSTPTPGLSYHAPAPTAFAAPTPALTPTPVGGVYLRGAGEALRSLGALSGVAVDEVTGRLVLLSREKGPIDLPPLRLDDVVTVFRSVYDHGEAPFVSIDPDPKDPQGPSMVVRHGAATADTYVGWVLFEADRIMKAYSLGFDNVSRSRIDSKISHYQSLLDLAAAPEGASGSSGERGEIWERFWIVPARVDRQEAAPAHLTLVDVPLRVNTQRMELRGGTLVPAADDRPSPQAARFAEWFTTHYDELAREAATRAPGGDAPVPFFAELRRIALVTAIAEALRGQGVPMPNWMRDYPVAPLQLDPRTPAIAVETSRTRREPTIQAGKAGVLQTTEVHRIQGGVSLSASDRDVHVAPAPPEADALGREAVKRARAVGATGAVELRGAGADWRGAVLPGDETRDIGANVLDEEDLAVPVQSGARLLLSRRFHSFFRPAGAFGVGWAPDLPRLQSLRRPVERSGDATKTTEVLELTSPFGSWSERFATRAAAPELGTEVIAPSSPGNMLGIVGAEDPRIGQPTKVLLFRDGRRWHFDGGGELVADVAAPSMVIYRRDGGRRIVRIEGWYGGELRADIRLEYDAAGRLAQARGSDGARIAYEYDSTGQLIRASGPRGAVEYGYRDGLVAAIRRDGAREVRFAYDARGALLREERDGERRVEYARVRSRDGAGVLATRKVAGGGEEMVEFDTALRPVRRVGLDGSEIRWRREAGESEAELVSPLGPVRVSRSADAHSAEVRLPAGGVVHATLDLAGRATSVRKGAEVLEEQEWRPDGQRARVRSGEAEARFGYRPDGLLDRIVFTPARATDGASGAWLDLTTDALGRPARIRDGSGYELRVGYDRTGAPASWASARAEVALERDDRGRVRALRTSFGYSEERAYDEASGDLVRTEIARGGARGAIEFERGRPARITELDGSQIRLTHYPADVHRGQVERLRLASGLELAYRYDRLDRVAAIDVGSASRLEYVYDDAGRLIAARQARR